MSDTKISTLLAAALTLAIGCSAGVKATNPSGAAGTTGTDGGVDRPRSSGRREPAPGGSLGEGGHDGNGRRGPAAVHAVGHLQSARRPLLQHHRQRLPGTEARVRRLPGRRDLQRRRDHARHLPGRRELPGDHLPVGRQRPVLRQDRRRLRA